jgi:hypothetical protein
VRGAEHLAGLGETGAGDGPGDAEVGEPRIPVGVDDDVGRLDVPVHDPRVVRRLERHGDLGEDAARLLRGDGAPVGDERGQRAALDELHDEVGGVALLAEVVDRHDVGVLQAGAVDRLGAEAFEERLLLGRLRTEHLHGDRPLELLVDRVPDLAHAPDGDDLLEAVAPGEEQTSLVGHRGAAGFRAAGRAAGRGTVTDILGAGCVTAHLVGAGVGAILPAGPGPVKRRPVA